MSVRIKKSILFVMVAIVAIAVFACIKTNVHSVAEAAEVHSKYEITVTENGKEYSSSKINEVVYNAKDHSVDVAIVYDGADYKNFTVLYKKDGEVLTALPKDAGDYEIVVSIKSDDVEVVALTYKYRIAPSPVIVHVDGKYDYVYSGSKYGRTVSVPNVYTGDECVVVPTYSYIDEDNNRIALGAGVLPKDAHEYEISYALSNKNYAISGYVGESPNVLNISPKELTVKADSITVSYGETPEYTITISGFVPNEDEKVIKVLPTVKGNFTAVGSYIITPSGGLAGNYTFTYSTGILTINALESYGTVAGTASEMILKGVFSPNTEYSGAFIDVDADEGKEIIKTVRERRAFPSFAKAVAIYRIDVSHGAQRSELINITMSNVTLDAQKSYSIISISPSGLIRTITKYSYAEGTLSFNSYGTGTFLIVENRADLATWLYIGIGLVVLIVLLILGSKAQYAAAKRDAAQQKRAKRRGKSGYEW